MAYDIPIYDPTTGKVKRPNVINLPGTASTGTITKLPGAGAAAAGVVTPLATGTKTPTGATGVNAGAATGAATGTNKGVVTSVTPPKPDYAAGGDWSLRFADAVKNGADDSTIQYILGERQKKIDSGGLTGKVMSNADMIAKYGYTPKPKEEAKSDGQGIVETGNNAVASGNPVAVAASNPNFDWRQFYSEIQGLMPKGDAVTRMTRAEAEAAAGNSLNPMYDQQLTDVLRAQNNKDIARGFFGQLPAEALKQETRIREANARASGIGDYANSLYSQSQQDALNQENLNMAKQNQVLGIVDSAFNKAMANKQFALSEADATGFYNGLKTLAAQNADRSFALQEGGLMGNYNGNRTLQGQQFDYGKTRDNVADNQWKQTFDFNKDRAKTQDNQWQQSFDWNKTTDIGNMTGDFNGGRTLQGQQIDWAKDPNNPAYQSQVLDAKTKQYEYDKLPEKTQKEFDLLDQQIKSGKIDIDMKTLELKNLPEKTKLELQGLQQDLANGKISGQIAQQELNNLRSGLTREGKNPNASADGKNGNAFSAKDYLSAAKNMINATVGTGQMDATNKEIKRPKYTKAEFETWLANLPITDQQYDEIVKMLNIDNIQFYNPPRTYAADEQYTGRYNNMTR